MAGRVAARVLIFPIIVAARYVTECFAVGYGVE